MVGAAFRGGTICEAFLLASFFLTCCQSLSYFISDDHLNFYEAWKWCRDVPNVYHNSLFRSETQEKALKAMKLIQSKDEFIQTAKRQS